MKLAPRDFDDRFALDERLTASELQNEPVAKLKKRLLGHPKLLVSHYGHDVAVVLDVELFREFVRLIETLEEEVDELSAARLVAQRLTKDVSPDEWASQAEFDRNLQTLAESKLATIEGARD